MTDMTPEQQQELKEKLENMSPEELKEFQKKQCIFCHIVSGKVSAKKIYEDDKVIAVLDINPANPGHVLLMPKEHHMIMPQLPEDELKHIFLIAKQLSNTVLRSLEVRGTNIIVANGPAAGQRAQHFMLHIIPRKEGDGIQFTLPEKKHSEQDLDEVASLVTEKLNSMLGTSSPTTQAIDILKKDKTEEAEFEEVDEAEEANLDTVSNVINPPAKDDEEPEEKSIDLDAVAKAINSPTEEEEADDEELEDDEEEPEDDEDSDDDEEVDEDDDDDEEVDDDDDEEVDEESDDDDEEDDSVDLNDIARVING